MWYYITFAVLLGYFINSDYFSQNLVIIKDGFTRLQELRKIRKSMGITLSIKTFIMICWLLWTWMWMFISQWLNNTVIMIGKNRYIVTFTIGGKRYSTIIKHKIGPSPILQVIDDNENDITTEMEPYLIFEPDVITPGDLGYRDITILSQDGSDTEIKKNDTLIKF